MIASLLASRKSPPLKGRCDAKSAVEFCSALCTLKPKVVSQKEKVFHHTARQTHSCTTTAVVTADPMEAPIEAPIIAPIEAPMEEEDEVRSDSWGEEKR
jgi:hypothetical protein